VHRHLVLSSLIEVSVRAPPHRRVRARVRADSDCPHQYQLTELSSCRLLNESPTPPPAPRPTCEQCSA